MAMLPKFLKIPPTKIVAIGLNYKKHAKELNLPIPKHPVIFLKPPTAIISNKENIIYPKQSKRVDYEAELAMVIKKKAKDVNQRDAIKYVEGYTCLNDVTARDLQFKDTQWTRAKSFDTFAPIGPRLVKPDKISEQNTRIQLLLNGKIKQNTTTDDMIFSIAYLISYISKIMTLNPGDIITTGTPAGIGPMKKGDTVEVRIDGIGSLKNYVK